MTQNREKVTFITYICGKILLAFMAKILDVNFFAKTKNTFLIIHREAAKNIYKYIKIYYTKRGRGKAFFGALSKLF